MEHTRSFLGDMSAVPDGQYVTMATYTAYPYSRGHLHITGPSITDPLDFDVGYLSDEHGLDMKMQVWAYKRSREIMRRTSMYTGDVSLGHPVWPAGSKAASLDLPTGEQVEADIAYSNEDDEAIEKFIKENLGTTWHSIATCKMAPREKNGVVDGRLNVWGTKGLKLADLSIPPVNVSGNTNNTAMMVGEKAADLIIKDLGL
jgi:alcohol oxidase